METIEALSYLLGHTSAIMQRQADQVLQERLGVGIAQFKLLTALHERPQVQQRFLAGSLGQTEASISRQVKLLTEKSMLVAQVNPKNRREHIMTLTPKGVKITQAAREILDAYHEPTFALLSDKEKHQLTAILHTMHLHCCEEGKPYACDLPWFSTMHQEADRL
jgi:DNA-binding MarR family transcriptional regulator